MKQMSVYEKLQEVQSRLNVPKNQFNSFGGYRYRSLEDIMEAVKPVLRDSGAVLIVGDDLVEMGGRFYVKATARFIDTDTGEMIENSAFARETDEKKGMDTSQITGAASSYARKYALNGLLDLDDVRDADSMDNTTKKLAAKYINSLKSELSRTGVSEKSMLRNYSVSELSELSFDQYQDAMDKLKSKPANAA